MASNQPVRLAVNNVVADDGAGIVVKSLQDDAFVGFPPGKLLVTGLVRITG